MHILKDRGFTIGSNCLFFILKRILFKKATPDIISQPGDISCNDTNLVLHNNIVSYNNCVGGAGKNTSPIKARGTIRCIVCKESIMNWVILLSVILALVAGTVCLHVPVKATFRLVGNSCTCKHNVNHLGKRPSSQVECAKIASNHAVLGRPVEWFIINPVNGTCNIRNYKPSLANCSDMLCGQYWSRN